MFLFPVIWDYTPHIYISALPFTPPTSKISQIYLPKFPNTVKVTFQQTKSLPEHTSFTVSLSHLGFSPDGTMLISCFGRYREAAVHIRSTQDYSLLPLYQACHHPDGIRVAKFSHDNHFLYCLTWEGAILSWEPATRQFTEIHPTGISDFDTYGEKIIACCEDGNVRIWAREELEFIGPELIHVGNRSLILVAVSPHGLVAVAQQRSVHIIDLTSHTVLDTGETEDTITALAFSDTGHSVVASLHSNHYMFSLLLEENEWRPYTQRKTWGVYGWAENIVLLKEKLIACIGWGDATATLWDVHTQSVISGPLHHVYGLHEAAAYSHCKVSISPDGKTLATGAVEDCIKIWNLDTLLTQERSAPENPLNSVISQIPVIAGGCRHRDEWITSYWGGIKYLYIPSGQLRSHSDYKFGLKYTTIPGAIMELDTTNLLLGDKWSECYSDTADVYVGKR